MKVHGYECPECGAYHGTTRAVLLASGQMQLKCRYCNEIEAFQSLGSARKLFERVTA